MLNGKLDWMEQELNAAKESNLRKRIENALSVLAKIKRQVPPNYFIYSHPFIMIRIIMMLKKEIVVCNPLECSNTVVIILLKARHVYIWQIYSN